jgi:predicted ester cyclase
MMVTQDDNGARASHLKSVAVRSIHCMASGTPADFDAVIHPQGFTRERRAAPPSARGTGPEAFQELAKWLRAAFADLHYDIHIAAAEGDVVTVNSTMNGRHVAPIVFYTEDAAVDTAFPPTGRTFAITQSHWFRFEDDKIVEHWANRDDLGQAQQLGWLPPTPAYLARMAWAKRRAKRR